MKFCDVLKNCLNCQENESVKTKQIMKAVFFLYFLLLLKVIVFKYPLTQLADITNSWEKGVILEGLDSANFTLFKTIKMYIRYWDRLNSFENLFGNVLCFIPFGFMLPFFHKESRFGWVLLINAFLLVCGIEVFQLVTAFGAFDVDDILLNCFGAMLGHLIFLTCSRFFSRQIVY